MAASKNRNRNRNKSKRTTATIDLKAKEVPTTDDAKSAAERVEVGPATGAPKMTAAAATKTSAAREATAAEPMPSPDASKNVSSGASSRGVTEKPSSLASAEAGSDKRGAGAATAAASTGASASQSAKSLASSAKTTDKAPAAKSPDNKSERTKSGGDTPAGGRSHDDGGGRRGFGGAFTHAVAGGLGGVIALVGASQFTGDSSNGGTTSSADIAAVQQAYEQRIAALETRIAGDEAPGTLPSGVQEKLASIDALEKQVAELSTKQQNLGQTANALDAKVGDLADPAGGGTVELRQRLDAMEATIESLGKAADGAGGAAIPKLAALAGRLNDTRTELEARIAAQSQATKEEVGKDIASLKKTLTERDAASATAGETIATIEGGTKRLSRALETAKTQLEVLGKDVTALKASSDASEKALEALQAKSTELAEQVAKLPGTKDVAAAVVPVAERVNVLRDQVAGVVEREGARAASAKNVLFALEVANLQRAVERGQPVTTQIASLKNSAPKGFDTASLDALASKDVPSSEALTRQFSGLAAEIVQSETVAEDASAMDRLFANARSIVRVRKTGDVKGGTTEAVVARAEDKLNSGSVSAAITELEALTGRPAETAEPWLKSAKARVALDEALAKLEAGLKQTISAAPTN
ncbi:MAG: mitofilin family membrane protein [Pseudomonadota bacterium]